MNKLTQLIKHYINHIKYYFYDFSDICPFCNNRALFNVLIPNLPISLYGDLYYWHKRGHCDHNGFKYNQMRYTCYFNEGVCVNCLGEKKHMGLSHYVCPAQDFSRVKKQIKSDIKSLGQV